MTVNPAGGPQKNEIPLKAAPSTRGGYLICVNVPDTVSVDIVLPIGITALTVHSAISARGRTTIVRACPTGLHELLDIRFSSPILPAGGDIVVRNWKGLGLPSGLNRPPAAAEQRIPTLQEVRQIPRNHKIPANLRSGTGVEE